MLCITPQKRVARNDEGACETNRAIADKNSVKDKCRKRVFCSSFTVTRHAWLTRLAIVKSLQLHVFRLTTSD